MILDCKEEKIIEYFSYSYFVIPKVKEIILTILNKIWNIWGGKMEELVLLAKSREWRSFY